MTGPLKKRCTKDVCLVANRHKFSGLCFRVAASVSCQQLQADTFSVDLCFFRKACTSSFFAKMEFVKETDMSGFASFQKI